MVEVTVSPIPDVTLGSWFAKRAEATPDARALSALYEHPAVAEVAVIGVARTGQKARILLSSSACSATVSS
jgi:hypothetical protein